MKIASIVPAIALLSLSLICPAPDRAGAATVSVPVKVVNSPGEPVPTLSLGTTNVSGTVNIGSMPSVQLGGTPTVNVANFPPVSQSGTTQLVSHQVVALAAGDTQALDSVDVSPYRDVRVVATGTGDSDFQILVYIVDETGQGGDLLLEGDIIGGSGQGTRLYEVPGRRIKVVLMGPSMNRSTVSVSLFGRS